MLRYAWEGVQQFARTTRHLPAGPNVGEVRLVRDLFDTARRGRHTLPPEGDWAGLLVFQRGFARRFCSRRLVRDLKIAGPHCHRRTDTTDPARRPVPP
jgi:hypothetical protein